MQPALKAKFYLSSATNVTNQTLRSQIGDKGRLVGIKAIAPGATYGGGATDLGICLISLYTGVLSIPVCAVVQSTVGNSRTYWLGSKSPLVTADDMSLTDGDFITDGIYGSLPYACPNRVITDSLGILDYRISVLNVVAGSVVLYYIDEDEVMGNV